MTKILNILLTLLLGLSPGNIATTPSPTSGNDNLKPLNADVGSSGSTLILGGSTSGLSAGVSESLGVGSGGSSALALSALKATTAAKKTTVKTCEAGYAVNPETNRCKKLVTVSETSTTVTTTTWNPATGETTTVKTCKSSYWFNSATNRCNKIVTCSIGYEYQPATNTCKKIICEIGFKVQDASNKCKRLVCEFGHIINQQTGNCVINNHGKYKECELGWTLDLRTLKCAKIGTKGSDDLASRKSQGKAVYSSLNHLGTVSSNLIRLANASDILENTDAENIAEPGNEKTCPEGKFLNPATNRCKNLQTISESSTGKTITTYDP